MSDWLSFPGDRAGKLILCSICRNVFMSTWCGQGAASCLIWLLLGIHLQVARARLRSG